MKLKNKQWLQITTKKGIHETLDQNAQEMERLNECFLVTED